MNKTLTFISNCIFIPGLLWIGIMFFLTQVVSLSKLGIIPKEIYNENSIGLIILPFCLIYGIKSYCSTRKAERASEQRNIKNNIEYFQEEIKQSTKEIEIHKPAHKNTYYNRGDAKFYLQDYLGAITDFTKAIELDPNYVEAYYKRGLAKHFLQDYTRAITDYSKAIELDPNHASTNYYRGRVKLILRDFKGATIDYTKAIEVDPNYGKAYKDRGRAKFYLGNYVGAIADYTRSMNPNHASEKLEKEQKLNYIFERNRGIKK